MCNLLKNVLVEPIVLIVVIGAADIEKAVATEAIGLVYLEAQTNLFHTIILL